MAADKVVEVDSTEVPEAGKPILVSKQPRCNIGVVLFSTDVLLFYPGRSKIRLYCDDNNLY